MKASARSVAIDGARKQAIDLEELQGMKKDRVGVYERYRRRLVLPFLTPGILLYVVFLCTPP